MNDIKYSLLVCDYLVPKYAIATVISKALHFTVGRISTQYFFVEVRSWNLDIILSNIICQLHAKLNFGIFCYSLRWLKKLLTFSSEIFFVTMFLFLPWKKRKQIAASISTFWFLYNKELPQCEMVKYCWKKCCISARGTILFPRKDFI